MNVLKKFDLTGQTSLVTGAAMGLGKVMTQALAEVGSNIVIADMNEEVAQKTAEEFRKTGVEVLVEKTDITDPDQVQACCDAAMAKFGKIDVLVNNAGILMHEKIENVQYKDWLKTMDVNLNGTFLMSQVVGREMIKAKKGSIVNISSMSGLIVNNPQMQASYNTSKAAVIHLTKCLASEWAKHNIRVNTIAPGYMKTDLTKHLFEAEENKELVKRWMSMSPMNRTGTPDELEGIIVFLASRASSFVTGACYSVDGGFTIW